MMWRCSIRNAWNPREKKSNNMHFSFVPNTHSQKEIAAAEGYVGTYITYLQQRVTELRRQFHLHNGYGICWPRSSSANHRQSPLLFACKCILLLMLLQIDCASLSVTIRKPVLASSFSIQYPPPFPRQTKIGQMAFLAICNAINNYFLL